MERKRTGDKGTANGTQPEDVGGVSGFAEFLETIQDRDDKERVGTLEWADGWFDPDEFDATTATKSMWKGLRLPKAAPNV